MAAQAQSYGHLTIFSEDGDPFTLILNGEKINDVPQTNLRVEELNQPYYKAKIIFADGVKEEISKSISITDVDNVYKDVTYKIRRDKNNSKKMKLSYFSEAEVRPDFVVPSSVQVIRYGHPQPVMQVGQTTTTTTTTVGGPVMNAGVSVNGVGVGISMHVNDAVITETTHTTTTVGHTQHAEPPVRNQGCRGNMRMSGSDFAKAIESLSKQNFEDSKMKMAKQIAQNNCMSSEQILSLCSQFKFDDNRLELAKYAYKYCTDPQSYFRVNDVFEFSSNMDALSEYVSNQR